jgi:ribosomal protein S5
VVVAKRFYEHYRNQREQAILPPAPENMPRDEDGNEALYFFDDLCRWLFALESQQRKSFMKWLVTAHGDRTSQLAKKIHFAYVRTKLAGANIKVEVPKELKREEIFYERMVLAGQKERQHEMSQMGAKRLREAYDLPAQPGKMRELKQRMKSEDNVPAFLEEFANVDFQDSHRVSNRQTSFVNHKTSKIATSGTLPSSWNELSLSMTGTVMPPTEEALNEMVSTDSEQYMKDAFSSEGGMYAQFPFSQKEFHKYNTLLSDVEAGNRNNERAEQGFSNIGAEDDDNLQLEYSNESYEKHGGRYTYPEGYYGEKFDPKEVNFKTPFNLLDENDLLEVRKRIPGIFSDNSQLYEEYILKESRNTVAKTRGRVESFNAYILIVSPSGFIGAGFGEAPDQGMAVRAARKNAILNLRAVPRSAYPLMRNEIRCKFMKSEVIFYPSVHRNPTARPLFKRILQLLGIEFIAVKCYGSNNILHTIPAFFKCLDRLKTVEKEALQRGLVPKHLYNKMDDYMEKVGNNRGIYGWH